MCGPMNSLVAPEVMRRQTVVAPDSSMDWSIGGNISHVKQIPHSQTQTCGNYSHPSAILPPMTEQHDSPQALGQPPAALVAALRKLLRPLVRLLLARQITYPYLINLLKSIYVEVADLEFQAGNKRQTDSRITLLTGVHRKDVKRLRTEQEESAQTPRTISAGAQIIGVWLGSPEFVDDSGAPLALPLRSSVRPASGKTFDDLVEIVCRQDIRPRVILDEWLHLGIASLDADNRVTLHTGAFTPDKGFDEKAFFFGKNIHDHLSAGAHNLLGLSPSYFDRSVYYDKLSLESIRTLSDLARQTGMSALTTMNRAALQLQKRDETAQDRHHRMNFGVFHFDAKLPASAADEDNDHA